MTRKMGKQVEKRMELQTEILNLSFKFYLKLSFCVYSNHVTWLLFKKIPYF